MSINAPWFAMKSATDGSCEVKPTEDIEPLQGENGSQGDTLRITGETGQVSAKSPSLGFRPKILSRFREGPQDFKMDVDRRPSLERKAETSMAKRLLLKVFPALIWEPRQSYPTANTRSGEDFTAIWSLKTTRSPTNIFG